MVGVHRSEPAVQPSSGPLMPDRSGDTGRTRGPKKLQGGLQGGIFYSGSQCINGVIN